MAKQKSKRLDLNQIAASIVSQTTERPVKAEPEKNPAAVALGRLGGLKGGKARARSMSARQRVMIAKKAAQARWKRVKKKKM